MSSSKQGQAVESLSIAENALALRIVKPLQEADLRDKCS